MSSIAVVAALTLSACGGDDDDADTTEAPASDDGGDAAAPIVVTDAWSRQPADGQTVTAIYGTVTNSTDEDITVVAATTPVTDQVELHETLANDDGTMSMREVDGGFVVPAGGEFVFESGGPHVMLFGIDPATYPTDVVSVTFEFDSADPVTVDAEVRALAGGEEMDHGDMSGEMDDMSGEMDEMSG